MLDGISADTMEMMVYVVISLKWLTGFDLEIHSRRLVLALFQKGLLQFVCHILAERAIVDVWRDTEVGL